MPFPLDGGDNDGDDNGGVSALLGFFPPLKPFPLWWVGGTVDRSPLDGSDESLTVPPDGSDDLLNRSFLMGRMTY